MIEAGNPANSERFLPMLKRHSPSTAKRPQAGADRGFASCHSLSEKALGVNDLAFHKKPGLRIKDMAKSNWVYRKLRNFRAGSDAPPLLKRLHAPETSSGSDADSIAASISPKRLGLALLLPQPDRRGFVRTNDDPRIRAAQPAAAIGLTFRRWFPFVPS